MAACGPILLTIYIHGLQEVINNIAKLFADNTKIYSTVNTPADNKIPQDDINKLHLWSKKWLLKFNESKCKDVHFGTTNEYKYYMNVLEIYQSNQEKDLGIIIDNKLNVQERINSQAKKANQKV